MKMLSVLATPVLLTDLLSPTARALVDRNLELLRVARVIATRADRYLDLLPSPA